MGNFLKSKTIDPIDPNDRFMCSRVDTRIINNLATEIWQLTAQYLPSTDICHLAECCKYLNNEVVWGRYSHALLWGETDLEKGVYKLQTDINDETEKLVGTVLMAACGWNAPSKQVSILIKAGANVNTCVPCLSIAVSQKNVDNVRILLDARADPNNICYGFSPLHIASAFHEDKILDLLNAGANIDQRSIYVNRTPLMMACVKNNVIAVRTLVNARADISLRDSNDLTALDIARRDREIVRILEDAAQSEAAQSEL